MGVSDLAARQAVTARWMGYPDAAAMNAQHDPLHRSLCTWLGVTSHALRDAAGEALTEGERYLAALEEDAVLHLQKFICHARLEVPPCS